MRILGTLFCGGALLRGAAAGLAIAGPGAPAGPVETLTVNASGVGEPIVLIPGLCASAYAYRDLVPKLNESGFRTIVVEPLGVGHSSRPNRGDYSLGAQAERIASLLQTLGVRHAIVLAHSLSGSIAMRIAHRHPDLVSGIVSMEGGPAETVVTPGLRRIGRFARFIKWFGSGDGLRKRVASRMVASSGDPTWVRDGVVAGYTEGAAANFRASVDCFAAMSRSIETDSLRPYLAGIDVPVALLLGGAPHEGSVPPVEVETLRRSLRHLDVRVVPGAGHFLHEERPDVVLEAIQKMRREAAGADSLQTAMNRGEPVRSRGGE